MHLATHVYWGPNPFSTRPCVIFRFETLAPAEVSRLFAGQSIVSSYLQAGFGYEPAQSPKMGSDGLTTVLGFLATAALFVLNHVRGELDDSGYRTDAGCPLVYVEFHDPALTLQAVKLLLEMVLGDPAAATASRDASLHALWDRCQAGHPDFQAHALISAAKARRIHVASLGRKVWLYGMGAHGQAFFETSTVEDMTLGCKTDKLTGKRIFDAVGAPTAPYRMVASREALPGAVADIGFPCVIKPIRAGAGRGVTANLQAADQLAFAYAEASRFSKAGDSVMLEKHVPGRDYRLLFVRGEFVACASSVAPFVTGDGVRSIEALVAAVNAGRPRSLYRSGYLRPIKVDASVRETLAVQGLDLQSVLPAGTTLSLRRNTNLGGGGISQLFPGVHADVVAAARRIAQHAQLHSVGIDYITQDITASPAVSGGMFTELNKVPGTPLLLAAGFDIVSLGAHFLGEGVGNIELRLHVLRQQPLESFMATYSGGCALQLPDTVVKAGTTTRFAGGHFKALLTRLLSDKSLHALDIVATPEFLQQHGLPTEHLSEVIVGASCMSPPLAATLARLPCAVRLL